MPLLVVAVAWAAQGGVLGNGWVWDDAIVVRDDPTIARGFGAIPRLLSEPWAGPAQDVGLYRPLVSITLAVEAALHGTADPFPFHLVNLFLHASVATALLAVLLRLFPSRPVLVSTAALFFAAHPVHTGTVSWIVARGDLLAALFLLGAVLVWTRGPTTSIVAAMVASLLWFAALLSKEAAAVFPPVLLVLDAAIRGVRWRDALRTRLLAYSLLVVPAALWLVLRVGAVGGLDATAANAALSGRNLVERLAIGAGALVRTAAKLFVPAGLCGDGSNDPILSARAPLPFAYVAALALVLLATSVALASALRRKAGPASAAVGLFVVLSLPVMQIVPIGAVFEDRFAYVPSLALLVLVGLAAEKVVGAVRPRALAWTVAVAALASMAAAGWRVAADWRDEESFDRALIASDPGHLRAIDRLAHDRVVLARAEEARVAATPTRNDAERERVRRMHARAGAYAAEAVELLERARSLPAGRSSASILSGLGDAYLSLAEPRYSDALGAYGDLLRIKRVRVGERRLPVDRVRDVAAVSVADRRELTHVHANMAVAHVGRDELREAAVSREAAALWCPPGDPSEYGHMQAAGVAIWRWLGEPRRARPYLERAALLAPKEERERAAGIAADAAKARSETDELFDRAVAALDRPGGQPEALALLEQVVERAPDLAEAHVGIARVRRWKGDFRAAFAALDDATAALDRRVALLGAEREPGLRRKIAELRARYEQERDAPEK